MNQIHRIGFAALYTFWPHTCHTCVITQISTPPSPNPRSRSLHICVQMITCQPDRAAYGKDGFWFQWERANFIPLQSRNYCTNQYQILNNWLCRSDERELPNFVAIGFTGAAPHVGEIYSSRFSVFFLLFFLFFLFLFRQLAYRPQIATDFDVWWLKRHGLAWGCAFWVSKVLK